MRQADILDRVKIGTALPTAALNVVGSLVVRKPIVALGRGDWENGTSISRRISSQPEGANIVKNTDYLPLNGGSQFLYGGVNLLDG